MNAVGTIGEFIINYQYEIEIGLLVILGLIILFAVVRAFARAVKRKTLLEEISGKVDDISEALNAISKDAGPKAEAAEDAGNPEMTGPSETEKAHEPAEAVNPGGGENECKPAAGAETTERVKAEADMAPKAPEPEKGSPEPERSEEAMEIIAKVPDDLKVTVTIDEVKEAEAAEKRPAAAGEKPGESESGEGEDFVPKKYFSRDCAVDKRGNRYTLEELEEQIK